jgi:hypothetical protein
MRGRYVEKNFCMPIKNFLIPPMRNEGETRKVIRLCASYFFLIGKKRFRPTKAPVSLVELKWEPTLQTPPCPNPYPLRLILNEQFRIDVGRGFDPVTLQQLVLTRRHCRP